MTEILMAVAIGLFSSVVLLTAGYQLGRIRGEKSRAALEAQMEVQRGEFRSQIEDLARSIRESAAVQQVLENEVKGFLSVRSSDAPEGLRAELDTIMKAVVEGEKAREDLRDTVHEVLEPVMQRERLVSALGRLETGIRERDRLPQLLDQIAATGGFSVVLLSDEAGLPLAASSATEDPEKYAGLASMLMILVERLSRDPGPSPVAIAIYNEAGEQILSRLFEVSGQQLMLTAVASGASLSPLALDPALTKLEAALVAES